MRRWWSTLFPLSKPCWFCSTPIRSLPFACIWKQICFTCQEHFMRINGSVCQKCGRPMVEEENPACLDCSQIDSSTFTPNRSVVLYQGQAKKIIQIFKYRGQERLAVPLGRWMAEVCFQYYRSVPFSLITYVPLHENRLKQRGFNQAELLAQVMGRQLRLPVQKLLIRRRETSSQSQRSRKERLQALQHAFILNEEFDSTWLSRQCVLLVDDVYTTGSTLRECVKPLSEIGVKQVYTITFAR
ncbi:ComF family protein [Thermoflavimicrobium daqui]|uniref:Phosphoribosyltransferase domain-containing protein n=1 Tax=Thermoflavimicrobium daqui TaxID=2137476 RepID=A0A364K5J4_9BACL|nr:ComF family protein [Thermoflavimicrobium daqui]RAL24551.1 hypothetical protein DL897_09595 [Thermoflavimicrobium daqui]